MFIYIICAWIAMWYALAETVLLLKKIITYM